MIKGASAHASRLAWRGLTHCDWSMGSGTGQNITILFRHYQGRRLHSRSRRMRSHSGGSTPLEAASPEDWRSVVGVCPVRPRRVGPTAPARPGMAPQTTEFIESTPDDGRSVQTSNSGRGAGPKTASSRSANRLRSPTRLRSNFSLQLARKSLVSLDSGKQIEIFGSVLKRRCTRFETFGRSLKRSEVF
jgi:hypothetical protein